MLSVMESRYYYYYNERTKIMIIYQELNRGLSFSLYCPKFIVVRKFCSRPSFDWNNQCLRDDNLNFYWFLFLHLLEICLLDSVFFIVDSHWYHTNCNVIEYIPTPMTEPSDWLAACPNIVMASQWAFAFRAVTEKENHTEVNNHQLVIFV